MNGPPRVLLLGREEREWATLRSRLSQDGVPVEVVAPSAEPEAVAARAREGETVVVVDLDADLLVGMEVVSVCRRRAPDARVVVVAETLPAHVAHALQASGAFRVVVGGDAIERLRDPLREAFAALGWKRPTPAPRQKILVVDDDRDFCAAIAGLLDTEGYEVICAGTGAEGLAKVESERPDLVVLDIIMEDEWVGYTFTQSVKFGTRDDDVRSIPILMVSSIQVDPATRFARAGEVEMVIPDAYMTKPVDAAAFLGQVKTLLGRRRPRPVDAGAAALQGPGR